MAKRSDQRKRLYSVTEAAAILGVCRQRVHQMLAEGKLDGEKVGSTWVVFAESVESARR